MRWGRRISSLNSSSRSGRTRSLSTISSSWQVTGLSVEMVCEMLCDVFLCGAESAAPLARLIVSKTLANPFFTRQFILTLTTKGLVRFKPSSLAWTWDLAQIEAVAFTDNVIDLLTTHELPQLSAPVRETLICAACLGDTFDIETLSTVITPSLNNSVGSANANNDSVHSGNMKNDMNISCSGRVDSMENLRGHNSENSTNMDDTRVNNTMNNSMGRVVSVDNLSEHSNDTSESVNNTMNNTMGRVDSVDKLSDRMNDTSGSSMNNIMHISSTSSGRVDSMDNLSERMNHTTEDNVNSSGMISTGIMKNNGMSGDNVAPGVLSAATLESYLQEAMDKKLVVRSEGRSYRFIHDRVQSAAALLVGHAERAKLHLKIARLLYKRNAAVAHEVARACSIVAAPTSFPKSGGRENQKELFDLCQHYVEGAEYISEEKECKIVALLCLKAGKRAKRSTAYESGLKFFEVGVLLCGRVEQHGASRTDEKYARKEFQVHLEFAQCLGLVGRFSDAELKIEDCISRSRNRTEKVQALGAKITLSLNLNNYEKGIDCGLECAAMYDINVDPYPSQQYTIQCIQEVFDLLDSKGLAVADLIHLPLSEDPSIQLVLKEFYNVTPNAFFLQRMNLFFCLAARIIVFIITNGLNPCSGVFFAKFSWSLTAFNNEFERSSGFASLAAALGENMEDRPTICRLHLFIGVSFPYQSTFIKKLEYLDKVSEEWKLAFDLYGHMIGIQCYLQTCFVSGMPIDDFLPKAEELASGVKIRSNPGQADAFFLLLRAAQQLRMPNPAKEAPDELYTRASNHPQAFVRAMNYYRQFLVAYCTNNFIAAEKAMEGYRQTYKANRGLALYFDFPWTFSVWLFWKAQHLDSSSPDHALCLSELKSYKAIIGIYAEACPIEFGSRLAMVRGDVLALQGKTLAALDQYEKAASLAEAATTLHVASMSAEHAAWMLGTENLLGLQSSWLRRARTLYGKWGITCKVRSLDIMLAVQNQRRPSGKGRLEQGLNVATRPLLAPSPSFDLRTVAKLSMMLSSEMSSELLLKTLMSIVLENAGAERGVLVLAEHGWRSDSQVQKHTSYSIKVKGFVTLEESSAPTADEMHLSSDRSSSSYSSATSDIRRPLEVKVEVQNLSLDSPLAQYEVPLSVMRFVIQTKRMVNLDNACQSGSFTSDPYVQHICVRSALCILRSVSVCVCVCL
mmetsp:Transcript_27996/g.45441  ORF Transcript_27996/g.45441 Transcript_27996/m.45441 type:complete len:1192 (+) Transcript_27996:1251-4826(+)